MVTQRPVVSTEEILWGPISDWEIDKALHYMDVTYTEEIDPDLFRIVFNSVLRRRTPQTKLALLTGVVCKETIFESRSKRKTILAGVMKVFNHRRQVKAVANKKKLAAGEDVRPATKQTEHPFGADKKQRVLL